MDTQKLRRGGAALCLAAAFVVVAMLISPEPDQREGLFMLAGLVALIGLWWITTGFSDKRTDS